MKKTLVAGLLALCFASDAPGQSAAPELFDPLGRLPALRELSAIPRVEWAAEEAIERFG